jgi:hypothetical protein
MWAVCVLCVSENSNVHHRHRAAHSEGDIRCQAIMHHCPSGSRLLQKQLNNGIAGPGSSFFPLISRPESLQSRPLLSLES